MTRAKWDAKTGYEKRSQMQTVILAGGLGTRLRPITDSIPKSMMPILGKPFIRYQIELLKRNELRDIVLCVGYKAEQIIKFLGNGKKFGVSIVYSEDGAELKGTAGTLKNAEPLLEDEFFVMNGDSYLPINFSKPLETFRTNNKLALMVVYKNRDRYDRSNVAIEDQRVVRYDRDRKWPGMEYIDYGLGIFKKEVLEFIPKGRFYQLDELFQKLIAMKQLMAFEVYRRFYEIGSFEGLKSFETYVGMRHRATG